MVMQADFSSISFVINIANLVREVHEILRIQLL